MQKCNIQQQEIKNKATMILDKAAKKGGKKWGRFNHWHDIH